MSKYKDIRIKQSSVKYRFWQGKYQILQIARISNLIYSDFIMMESLWIIWNSSFLELGLFWYLQDKLLINASSFSCLFMSTFSFVTYPLSTIPHIYGNSLELFTLFELIEQD